GAGGAQPARRARSPNFHDQASLAWFWAPAFCRTPQLGYLRGGFQLLCERLAEQVRERGGQIRVGEEVRLIRAEPDGSVRVETDRAVERFDQVLATLPTRLFARLAEGLPSDWLAR